MNYFFCGIAGCGMSAIAQYLRAKGFMIKGSDRSFDQNKNSQIKSKLLSQGILLFPQDGKALANDDILVVSTAVEASIPDIIVAKKMGLKIIHRSQLLAEIFNNKFGIAVAGTSGKSTTTAMVGRILTEAGQDPTIINGAMMPEFNSPTWQGNVRVGDSDFVVIEADESDGSLVNYHPEIGLINNITLDHKPLDELQQLFNQFIGNSETIVANLDCPEVRKLPLHNAKNLITISNQSKEADLILQNIERKSQSIDFQINGIKFNLPMLGAHNAKNALAASAIASAMGISLEQSAKALHTFSGIERRMEIIGTANEITVIDDYAHNPDKIKAALQTVCGQNRRTIVVFQPHGFGPVKFMKYEFIDAFVNNCTEKDVVLMPQIYYTGGTADKSVSSNDLISGIKTGGVTAEYIPDRNDIIEKIKNIAKPGDFVLLLGARDVTLAEFAQKVFAAIN